MYAGIQLYGGERWINALSLKKKTNLQDRHVAKTLGEPCILLSASLGHPTWLANEKADIVAEDGSIPVQEVTGQLHHDRQFGQFFQHLASLGGQGGGGQGGEERSRT